MKQPHYVAGDWIDAGQIRSFAEIAAMTGKGKVFVSIGASMLLWNDVLDVVG